MWGTYMSALVAGLYAALLIVAWLGYRYLASLPQRLHDEGLERFRHQLDRKLEQVRASLSEDIELSKITQEELQVRKTEEFIRLSEFYHEILSNPEKALEAENQQQLQKRLLDSAVRLFFFASDSTIDAYKDWWEAAVEVDPNTSNEEVGIELLEKYATLNVSMRQDLGYDETEASVDDFLAMILTDWEEHRAEVLDD